MKRLHFSWIHFISLRLSGLSRKKINGEKGFSFARIAPSLGIGVGVMALIVIIAVMNGFQSTSINSLMEISSYHVKITTDDKVFSLNQSFVDELKAMEEVECVIPMCEVQSLIVGSRGKQDAAFIRSVPERLIFEDDGFAHNMKMISGDFKLDREKSIILGTTLAKHLGVRVGDTVNLLALSGSSQVELFSEDRVLKVAGIFECPYLEINSTFAFTSIDALNQMTDNGLPVAYGIKLKEKNRDGIFIQKILKDEKLAECGINLSEENVLSWRVLNKSFFGALRIEKNVLLLLVLLIFLVVGINIYNGMRRMVFEKKEDICILNALGASRKHIQLSFVMQGFYVALAGAVPGLLLGLLISSNIDVVFTLISKITYYFQYFFMLIFSPQNAYYVPDIYVFLYYAEIPAIIGFWETFYVTVFGILSALISSYIASRKVMSFKIAEVLHDE